jgi:D-inositol-3-phosphate glycosyltransferase
LKAGINLDKLEPLNPETLITFKESQRDILFIGRNAHRRGVDILVRAFRMFNAENGNNFRLRIVGITPEEFNDADEKINVYPYLRKDDPRELAIYNELLASARLFVMPMRQGPVPGVIREAKWACTPVIISDIANAGERVTHEADGILVRNIHPEDFALQMTRLVQDRTRWREMALEAHRSASNETWDHTAGEFLKIFEAHTHNE